MLKHCALKLPIIIMLIYKGLFFSVIEKKALDLHPLNLGNTMMLFIIYGIANVLNVNPKYIVAKLKQCSNSFKATFVAI